MLTQGLPRVDWVRAADGSWVLLELPSWPWFNNGSTHLLHKLPAAFGKMDMPLSPVAIHSQHHRY